MADATTGAARAGFNPISFYFSPNGRATRKDVWLLFIVPYLVIVTILSTIDGMSIAAAAEEEEVALPILTTLFVLVALWPSVAVSVRRLHDRGRSGWFYLLTLVPLVNIWIMIEILFLRGTPGDNAYGPDPLG